MMKIALICAFVAVAAASPAKGPVRGPVPRLDGRIVGGRDATIEEFPHQISLQFYGSHACGGSIISEKYVVTAAHCTDGAYAGMLSIRAGSSKHSSGGQALAVKRIIQHPSFSGRTLDYDISILELDGTLLINDAVQPISLPTLNDEPSGGDTCTCSGWGTTSEGGSIPSTLKAVDLKIVSRSDCGNSYAGSYDITSRMICAGVGGGKDACQGDSGGPLISGNKLIGVVSWGIGCARPAYPGVYSNVANLRNYIKENTGV